MTEISRASMYLLNLILKGVFVLLLAFTFSGCSQLPGRYASPETVTLEQAMKDLACGLATLKNEQRKLGIDHAMLLDNYVVTLTLTASAKRDATLAVDASSVPAPGGLFGVGYTNKTTILGERGNQIKITFKSQLTGDLNDAGKRATKGVDYNLKPSRDKAVTNPCIRPPQGRSIDSLPE